MCVCVLVSVSVSVSVVFVLVSETQYATKRCFDIKAYQISPGHDTNIDTDCLLDCPWLFDHWSRLRLQMYSNDSVLPGDCLKLVR